MKVEKLTINPDYVDLEDIEELEENIKIAFRDGMEVAQKSLPKNAASYGRPRATFIIAPP